MSVEQEIIEARIKLQQSPEKTYEILEGFDGIAFMRGCKFAKDTVRDWFTVEEAEQIVLDAQ